jgi:hypothetical protein
MAQTSCDGGPSLIPGHVGFVVGKVALGQVFSEYFDFPCKFLFHQLRIQYSSTVYHPDIHVLQRR